MHASRLLLAPLILLVATGCAQIGLAPRPVDETVVREEPGRREPVRVVVQHVLVAHEGAEIPGVTRTLPEAERLAQRVIQQAQAGTSFDELVRIYGDDRSNDGILAVANFGVSTERPGEIERAALVKAFGNAAFALEVGEIRLVPYDAARSPFGYHVVTRLQ